MNRESVLLQDLEKTQLGIEIAPWFHPLVPKRDGWNAISLDIFDAERLTAIAAQDSSTDSLVKNIETVDLIGSACDIGDLSSRHGLTGTVDYVISSHNFEHLPDPIKFLIGCEECLKPGGVVSMAVPDRRTCFDYFRPFSTTADFLAAFHEKRTEPNAYQWLVQESLHCRYNVDGELQGTTWIHDDPSLATPLPTLDIAYKNYQSRIASNQSSYYDTHCWAFTPSSLNLILGDLRFLEVIGLDISFISSVNANEFYVRLTKPIEKKTIDRAEFFTARSELMHGLNDEAALNSRLAYKLKGEVASLNAATKGQTSSFIRTFVDFLRNYKSNLTR